MKTISQPFVINCIVVATLILTSSFCCLAQEDNQEIYNQLYQEIINTSGGGNSEKLDSMGASTSAQKSIVSPGKGPEVMDERLKAEMEKIVKDAQVRHSNAVKFMQDAK
jgi:hypothetical protein